jgi:hypothetical protein
VGLIRFIVVFLLGIGAAFGAYATGGFGYAPQHPWNRWFAPSHPVVLRVREAGRESACEARYVIDNHSSRRVLVLVTPEYEGSRAPMADLGNDSAPPSGYYGSSSAPDSGAPAVHTQTIVPAEVAPGEEKNVGPRDDAPLNTARAGAAAARCDNNRPVTLQLNDCATDESGVCSSASTFTPGGDYNRYQGDE